MIVPSIDIAAGRAIQLVGGEGPAMDCGDPLEVAQRFRVAGELAVIDLDAALGRGENREVIAKLCKTADVRVGGGIRDLESARAMLDLGAKKIILGTAAAPELLAQLPRDRVLVALDARDGEVVVDGWRKRTGRSILEGIGELKRYCSGFLITFVELEGRMGGTQVKRVPELVDAAGDNDVTIAGGVTTCKDLADLDRAGADAQVGMALYTGRIDLADAFAAPLISDREDGLWPTMICDERGVALGLAYSSRESLSRAIREQRGVYQSRTRGVWVKGESSGATQELLQVSADCDRDTLRFKVRQSSPGFCHKSTRTCFGDDGGLGRLERTLQERLVQSPTGSYTARLFADPVLLASKLREETDELIAASGSEHTVREAADLMFFVLVRAVQAGGSLAEIEAELDLRSRRVTRRAGDSKAAFQ